MFLSLKYYWSCVFAMMALATFVAPLEAQDALDSCLDQAIAKHGEYDESNQDFQYCYKSWAGTADSPVITYAVSVATSGPGPCYTRETVTLSDTKGMIVLTTYNDSVPKCRPSEEELSTTREYPLKLMEIETIRALANPEVLETFDAEYIDNDLNPVKESHWSFVLNERDPLKISINVEDTSALPPRLATIIVDLDKIIEKILKAEEVE